MRTPAEHPELKKLRDKCTDLRTKLKALVEEWHLLVTEERPRLTALYDDAFRDLERERQFLAVEAAELSRRVELLGVKVTRGEELDEGTIEHVNHVVDKEFGRYRQRVKEAFRHVD